ncbi:hypothetical protein B0H14DRAFT_3427001 [Mycena olivaceomarginata]|nr:hypothetical protein B0H14DRAFT_3427001 [Mycena olivaceomarginata]
MYMYSRVMRICVWDAPGRPGPESVVNGGRIIKFGSWVPPYGMYLRVFCKLCLALVWPYRTPKHHRRHAHHIESRTANVALGHLVSESRRKNYVQVS